MATTVQAACPVVPLFPSVWHVVDPVVGVGVPLVVGEGVPLNDVPDEPHAASPSRRIVAVRLATE
jgi:hypothetical protein